MKTYDECKKIAEEYTEGNVFSVNTAYEGKDAFVFDNDKETFAGFVPFVVDKTTGAITNLWHYLNSANLTMDDFKEITY